MKDHQFFIFWAKLYLAVHHIGPSWNRVSRTYRKVVTALERRAVEDALSVEEGGGGAVKLGARNVTKIGLDQLGLGAAGVSRGLCASGCKRSRQVTSVQDDA